MRKTTIILMASAALVSACSERSPESATEQVTTADIEAPMADMAPPPPPAERVAPPPAATEMESSEAMSSPAIMPPTSSTDPIAVNVPQIAYRYAMGFRAPDDAIKPLQNRHADLCEARGPRECRIVSMRQAEREGDYSYGSLQLAVSSRIAREFSKELEESSGTVDAELVSSSIDGEDLSKAIVDTEARLRARTVLRDRLMEILRNRNGTVKELVEAERGVAQVNEEIDQARSWLNEMRGRVAFSQMAITYESGYPAASAETGPGGFTKPILSAWNALGSILGSMIAFFMLALTVVVPIGLVIYGAVRLVRWAREQGFLPAQTA